MSAEKTTIVVNINPETDLAPPSSLPSMLITKMNTHQNTNTISQLRQGESVQTHLNHLAAKGAAFSPVAHELASHADDWEKFSSMVTRIEHNRRDYPVGLATLVAHIGSVIVRTPNGVPTEHLAHARMLEAAGVSFEPPLPKTA